MVCLHRCILIALAWLLVHAGELGAATPEETRLLDAARESFRGGFFERAETEFGEFVRKFPESTGVPEAILFQAEARLERSNYDGAISLLSSNQAKASTLVDQYLFWLAEAHSRKGDLSAAANLFGQLATDYPGSARRLEACLAEASARGGLGQWPAVLKLLEQTNGVFFQAVQSAPTNAMAVRGFLLLAEARLAQKDYPGAEAALALTTQGPPNPRTDWQRQLLLCRIRLAQSRMEEALAGTTNLLALAATPELRRYFADSVVLRAGILESLNRIDQAIGAWQQNLEGTSPERQHQALLKIAQLSLKSDKPADAAKVLEKYLALFAQASVADLALFTLGELKMRQHLSGAAPVAATNAPGTQTNLLQEAVAAFTTLTTKFPSSSYLGKAELNLGWCYALDGKPAESQKALAQAIANLPVSPDQATAYYKLADIQFQQTNYVAALSNYNALARIYGTDPQVRSNYLEAALYQSMRAAWATGDRTSATNALRMILEWFPNGFEADRAVLRSSEELGKLNDLPAARELLATFAASATNAALLPEIRLALARTYELEGKWLEAIQQYDTWIGVHTNHPALARAEYFRAWANFQAGNETNALVLLTNFVAHFPTNEFTPLARWRVADYYFGQGGPALVEAEKNYQLLFQNWPGSELAYQARMMAGRVALARQGWEDARNYFTGLWHDTNCPTDLRIQALSAYGDTLMSMDSNETNKLANYDEAIRVFGKIIELYPSNQVAVLAWGQKANCLLQYVNTSQAASALSNSCVAFQQVIDSPVAGVVARSIAKVGLAVALEKQAGLLPAAEQAPGLRAARDQLLDVFYGKLALDGEEADPFWTRKAGLEAARLCETLQEWREAVAIYEKLGEMLPPLRARFEKNAAKAREQLEKNRFRN